MTDPKLGTPATTTPTGNNAAWDADDAKDQARHAPVAPKDAGVLDSLGRSISDVVTGSAPETQPQRDDADPKPRA